MKVRWAAAFAASLLLLPSVLGASPPEIDVSEGVIDGQVAFSCWAVEGFEGLELVEDPSLEVHLVPAGGLDDLLTLPANRWVQPPPGRYKYWIEGDGWMSPSAFVMHFAEAPFEGRGVAVLRPVVSAGEVCPAPEAEIPPGLLLRLIHTESHNRGPGPLMEMSRQVILDQGRRCVRMPEGEVLGAWFDASKGEYLAISRPFEVYRGSRTEIEPRPPARSQTDLLVVLERPALITDHEGYDVELRVRTSEEAPAKEADLKIPTGDRIYAVWYGLEGRLATLEVSSPSVYLEPQEIVLRPGKVERFAAELRPLPRLSVRLELPPALSAAGPRTIEVTELPARRPVVRREASTRTQIVTFEHIPAGPLEVTLAVPPWRFAERVDLSDGADGEVVFQPSPIEVRGTVYRGTEEHPATVTFLTDPTSPEGRLVAATDEAGSYRATFFRDGYFAVLVELSDRSGRPYFEYLRQPIAETPILDFRLPANTFTVEVVDAASGEPIADAEVTAANRSSRPGEIHRSNRQRTDSDGRVTLSPQQEGELRIVAEADGYHRSEPREVSVTGGEEERQIRIALRSYGATSELTLLLPDGRPAPGAELLALGAVAGELPLWRGRTDEEGRTRLPEEAEGALLVARHPEAAFLLRRWRKPGVDGSPTVWRLEPPAPPLSVVVRSPWGEPAPWSRIVVEVDGVVLRGFLLRWLAETGSADAEGFWQAHHLPPRPLRLAAWAPGRQPIAGGFPEPFAVSVAFPWAGVIELQAID